MFSKNLFGLEKNGKFKTWSIRVEQSPSDIDEAVITIEHGKEGGVQTPKYESVTIGKQGRTPYEQAVSQAEGRIKKQIDKGYRESKEELQSLPLLPMLASDYNKVGHRIKFPCYTSVKYDGVRCLAMKHCGEVRLESRTGQPYSVPHIEESLNSIMSDGDILDGELYLHGYELQDITSAVKRTDTQAKIDDALRKIAKHNGDINVVNDQTWHDKFDELQKELEEAKLIHFIRPNLQFHTFDVPMDGTFEERLNVLNELYAVHKFTPFIAFTHYDWCINDVEMKSLHGKAVQDGFEGLMLRNLKGVYESGKRSGDLQKYKTFMDEEFLILDIVEDKQGHAVFVLKNNLNDLTFQCVYGDLSQRKIQLIEKNKLIGKFLNVQFQTRYKGTLLPQFGTGKYIRDGYLLNGTFIPYD